MEAFTVQLLFYGDAQCPSGFPKGKLLDEQETGRPTCLAGHMRVKNSGQTDLKNTKAVTVQHQTWCQSQNIMVSLIPTHQKGAICDPDPNINGHLTTKNKTKNWKIFVNCVKLNNFNYDQLKKHVKKIIFHH